MSEFLDDLWKRLRELALEDVTARPAIIERKFGSRLPTEWEYATRSKQAQWLQEWRMAEAQTHRSTELSASLGVGPEVVAASDTQGDVQQTTEGTRVESLGTSVESGRGGHLGDQATSTSSRDRNKGGLASRHRRTVNRLVTSYSGSGARGNPNHYFWSHLRNTTLSEQQDFWERIADQRPTFNQCWKCGANGTTWCWSCASDSTPSGGWGWTDGRATTR
jgi:hypothetical protein